MTTIRSGPRSEADDFDAFYRSTWLRVCTCTFALTGNLAEAQDATQEAYVRAWARWRAVAGYADPEAWVRTVAWRVAANGWRKARNRITAHRRHGPADPVPAPSEDTIAIITALQKLPPEQRATFVLHYHVGLTIAAVAQELGIPVGTVKARLSRGRTVLSGLLSVPVEEQRNA